MISQNMVKPKVAERETLPERDKVRFLVLVPEQREHDEMALLFL